MAERPILKIPDLIAEKRQFEEAIIGQPKAVEAFAGLAARIRSGIRPRRSAPIGISFLAGPSGVGKTEIVNRLAEVMAGGQSWTSLYVRRTDRKRRAQSILNKH